MKYDRAERREIRRASTNPVRYRGGGRSSSHPARALGSRSHPANTTGRPNPGRRIRGHEKRSEAAARLRDSPNSTRLAFQSSEFAPESLITAYPLGERGVRFQDARSHIFNPL